MKLSYTLAIVGSASLLVAAGAAAGNADAETKTSGTVTGKIVFEGEKPEPKPLTISEEQSKGCCPEGVTMDMTDYSLLIDEDGGIQNAVITIEVEGKKLEPTDERYAIDQVHCRFDPHVLVLPAGATVYYLNSDQVSHNIHTYSTKNEPVNRAVSAGSEMAQKLGKAEVVKVSCDYHPWMSSYIFVTETPYYAVSKADGSFEIAGLEPGKYKAEIWHEQLGKTSADVEVAEDGSAAPIEVKMGEDKKAGGRRRR